MVIWTTSRVLCKGSVALNITYKYLQVLFRVMSDNCTYFFEFRILLCTIEMSTSGSNFPGLFSQKLSTFSQMQIQ